MFSNDSFTPQWTVVCEHFFGGLSINNMFAKSLFIFVHEQLYGIVQQCEFIPRWWTPPNSLADYLFGKQFAFELDWKKKCFSDSVSRKTKSGTLIN